MKQSIRYILDNAFKFTRTGQVSLGFQFGNGNEVILFVKDTGIGIPKEKMTCILNKFRQGDETSTRQYGGLGLGLTLAHEFITLQGGKLWLDSIPDQGTTVYCSFAYQTKIQLSNKGNGIPPPSRPVMDLSGKRILVAEDSDSSYFVLEFSLKKTGAQILRAHNGLEAIEICRQEKAIDLVLMDLQMPVINGYAATREILSFNPELPVIAQTAYSLDFDEKNALEAGCIAYLVKPLDMAVLFEIIQKRIISDKDKKSAYI